MAYSELGIKLTADDKAFLQSLRNIEAKISGLSKVKVKVDVATTGTAIPKLQQQLSSIKPPQIKFEDIKPIGGLDKLKAQLESTRLRYEKLFTATNPNLSSIKNAEIQIGSLKQRITDFGSTSQSLSGVQNGFVGIGSAIKGLAGVLGILVGIKEVIDQIKNAVSVNIQLEDSLVNVKRTVGLTTEQTDKLEESLLGISKTTRTSVEDLITIAQVGGQLGVAGDKIVPFTDSMNKLNVALSADFQGNVEEVVKNMGGLRNILNGVKTENIEQDFLKLGNAILKLGNDGAATGPVVADIATRIAGLAPNAKAEEILGLAANFQDLNINAERGASSIGRLLNEISKPTTFDKDGNITGGIGIFAKQIGITEEEFKKLVNTSQTDAFLAVAQSFNEGSLSTTEFTESLANLGIEGVGITEVFNAFSKNIDTVKGKIKLAGDALKTTDGITQAYNESNNTTQANIEKTQNQFKALQSDFGKGLSNPFSDIIKAISEIGIENIFKNIYDGLVKIFGIAMNIIDPFGLLQGILSILQTGFSNFIGIIKNVFKAFEDPKVQESLNNLWIALEPIRAIFGEIKKTVLEFFNNLNDGSKEGSENLYSIDNIVNVLSTTFNFLADAITLTVNVVKTLITWFQQAYNTVSWFITSSIEFFGNLYNTVSSTVINIYNTIKQWFESAYNTVSGIVDSIIKFFTDLPGNITNALGSITDVFAGWINGALDIGTKIKDNILGGLGNLGSEISNRISGAISGAGNVASSAFSGITSSLGLATGGLVPQYLATGGVASGANFVKKGTDTVPAMLTPGEYVVKKDSVDTLGKRFLDIINNDAGKVKYALNGLLSTPSKVLTSGGSNNSFITNDNKEVNINVNYNNSTANPHTLLYNINSLTGLL